MSKRANPRLVGGFVLGAVALAVAALLVFGSGKFLLEKYPHVVFFEGSVMGLSVGAPVTFRGVQVGEVTGIHAVSAPVGEETTIYIEVIVDIYPDLVRSDLPTPQQYDHYQDVESLVDHGLRARLETQSMITGQRYVSLDFYPDEPLIRKGLNSTYHELPTVPTTTQEWMRTVDRALARIEQLPIQEILEKMQHTLEGLDRVVSSPELTATIESLNDGMRALEATAGTLQESITSTTAHVDSSAAEMRRTFVEAQKTLNSIHDVVAEGKVLHYETLDNLNDTLSSIRVLVEYLEQHPEAFVSGKGDSQQ